MRRATRRRRQHAGWLALGGVYPFVALARIRCGMRGAARPRFRVQFPGFDGMVEAQILGQIKDAVRAAIRPAPWADAQPYVPATSFAVAKECAPDRDRGPFYLAAAAVRLGRTLFEDWQDTCLFVGAGEMGEWRPRTFSARNPKGIAIANRTSSAATLARASAAK